MNRFVSAVGLLAALWMASAAQAVPNLIGDQQFGCAQLGGSGCAQFIPDGAIASEARISSSFTIPAQPFCAYGGVSVIVVALHGAPGDLELRLRHVPSGTDITQPAALGVGNLVGNDLDRVIPLPAFPPTGGVAGTWQLEIEDLHANDYGHLLDWRVVLDCPIQKTIQEIGGTIPFVAEAGETLRYQIVLRNDGPWPISTSATDPIPAGTTFVSANNGGVLVGNTVNWGSLTVAPLSQLTLQLDVLVDAVAPPGQIYILNQATVGGTLTTCETVINAARCDATAIVRVDDLFRNGFEGP